MTTLEIIERNTKGNVALARKEGLIPVVYYGAHVPSTSVYIKQADFMKTLRASGESTLINLVGGKEKVQALIHEIQFDPLTGLPLHVDFYVADAKEKLKAKVHLNFVGVSEAVKSLGATLAKIMHEIEVECLPKDLPASIEVDISILAALDSHITVGDLVLPHGVTAHAKATDIIATASIQKEIVEETTQVDLGAIEVEKKGKKEEEETAK